MKEPNPGSGDAKLDARPMIAVCERRVRECELSEADALGTTLARALRRWRQRPWVTACSVDAALVHLGVRWEEAYDPDVWPDLMTDEEWRIAVEAAEAAFGAL